MTYRYWAKNMCDSGINETVQQVRDSVKNLIEHAFEDIFDNIPVVEIVDGEKTVTDWGTIPKSIIDYVLDNLDEAVENVVQDIDNHMETVKEGAIESVLESGDYIHCDDLYEIESERDELSQKVDELEEELEEAKTVITVDGIDCTWIPERQRFVSRIGHVFAVQEVDDDLVSATLAC